MNITRIVSLRTELTRWLLRFMVSRHFKSLLGQMHHHLNLNADAAYAQYQAEQALVAAKRNYELTTAATDAVISNVNNELATLPDYK